MTWFATKSSDSNNKKEVVLQAEQQLNHEDSVLSKVANTHSKLGEAIEAGDRKVVSTIEQAANTITTLKEEVGTLKEEVKQLTNENKTLKAIVSNFTSSDTSSKFNLLPIIKGN